MDVPRVPTTRPNALCDLPLVRGRRWRDLAAVPSVVAPRACSNDVLRDILAPIAARLQMLCSRFQVAVAPCIQSRKLRRTDVPHPHLAVPAAAALLSKSECAQRKERSVRFGHGESFGKIPTPAFAWLWAPPLVVVASCPCGSSGQNLPVQRARIMPCRQPAEQ